MSPRDVSHATFPSMRNRAFFFHAESVTFARRLLSAAAFFSYGVYGFLLGLHAGHFRQFSFSAFRRAASNSSPLFQRGIPAASATRQPSQNPSRASSIAPEKSHDSWNSSDGWW
jgi:hypothetical protein